MTKSGETTRIRYDEGCLAAHALNLIGDRWALLVVRELFFAPKRFQLIRAGLPGVTASVLTARLAQLREAGVLIHDATQGLYALRDSGRALLPVLEALCRWALLMPGHDHKRFISPSALMISMGVNLTRDPIGTAAPRAGFDFGAERFTMQVDHPQVATRATAQPDAPFLLKGSGNAMAIAVYGPTPVAQLAAQRVIAAEGDLAAAQDFVDLFRLEAHAAPATSTRAEFG
ncbi:helix-turn-helix domain-containing protein [Paracoccus sp. S1E-3]|uniref:winged helix-turn-helix transcriptional regulator n=1 Tax=Paracoccus sp. S1E-3 TaxID=2756130 RepID=UPI0015EFA087|nr:helix-turn-helix domain-containing protein [Paracoccus sp. S1E-3]MBA4492352.1 helix-turn-helix transcriptional regulator [Paracoccus sp. S1E-3]